jgi:acetyl esterase/lipase
VTLSRRTALAGLAGFTLLAGCAPLAVLDRVAPKDAGGVLLAADAAYGSDPRQRLDVYGPEAPGRPRPVILFVYGGSWSSGSRHDYSFVGRALAARGYTVVVIDYRLVPQVRFPGFVEDVASALRWTRDTIARYGGDPARIGLLGHSAGAYNVMMATLDRHYLRDVGLPRTTIRAAAGLAGPYDFLPLDADATKAAFGAAADLSQTQPITFARRDAPPIFLATGDADTTVYPRNTHRLAAELRAAGAPVEERTYPGVGHPGILLALSLPFRGKAPVLDDVDAFFRARL